MSPSPDVVFSDCKTRSDLQPLSVSSSLCGLQLLASAEEQQKQTLDLSRSSAETHWLRPKRTLTLLVWRRSPLAIIISSSVVSGRGSISSWCLKDQTVWKSSSQLSFTASADDAALFALNLDGDLITHDDAFRSKTSVYGLQQLC